MSINTLLIVVYVEKGEKRNWPNIDPCVGSITNLTKLIIVIVFKVKCLFFRDAGDVKLNVVFLNRYMKSHARASAYMIGMALGYLIHLYKPKDYRNIIYKVRLDYNVFYGAAV